MHTDDDYDLDDNDDCQALVPAAKSFKRDNDTSGRTPLGENRRSSFLGKMKGKITRSLSQRGSFRRGSSMRRNSTIDVRMVPTASANKPHPIRETLVPIHLTDYVMSQDQAENSGLSEETQKRRHILGEIIDGELRLHEEMKHVLRIYVDSSLLPVSDDIKECIFNNYEELFLLSGGNFGLSIVLPRHFIHL